MAFGRMGARGGFGSLGLLGASRTVSYSAEALAVFAAMTTPPSTARKTLINNLIAALKTAGIWSALDIFYVMAAADSQAARLNWKNPGTFSLAPTNAPTFATDRGFTGDGSSSFLDTGYTPSVNGVQHTLNSASLWVWVLNDVVSINSDAGNITAPRDNLVSRSTGDVAIARVNTATSTTAPNASGIGFFGGQRTDAATQRIWKNGVKISSVEAVASTALASSSQWVCGGNPGIFSLRQESVAAYGASLSGLENSFYTATLAYMQAVGAA